MREGSPMRIKRGIETEKGVQRGTKETSVGLFRSIHPHITEMLLQLHRTLQWLPESHPLSLFAPIVAMNLAG